MPCMTWQSRGSLPNEICEAYFLQSWICLFQYSKVNIIFNIFFFYHYIIVYTTQWRIYTETYEGECTETQEGEYTDYEGECTDTYEGEYTETYEGECTDTYEGEYTETYEGEIHKDLRG